MRILPILLCAGLFTGQLAQARSHNRRTSTQVRHTPAQAMLNTLDSMTLTLNSVQNKATADAAAPILLTQHQKYQLQRDAADSMPELPEPALIQHLSRLDKSMNNFRLACARLLREKCYGSSRLGEAIRKVVQAF